MSKNWPASKSCDETLKVVHKVDHSRNPSSLSDSKHFVCSTCQKCVCNANHDVCVTNFLKEVNSRAKVQSHKNSNKPVKPKSHTQKPGRQIAIGQRFSLNKSSAVHEKPNTPRSCLRWKPTGRIFKTAGLRWIPTKRCSSIAQPRLTVNPQMVQMKISLTYMNANKLLMSVHGLKEFKSNEQELWRLQTTLQASFLKEKKGVRFSALYL
ncbi:hypothetical protein Tco_1495200 [Tanacetum coccineum]